MPSSLTNYICPGCGGRLKFDPDSQKVQCEFCKNEYSVEEVKEFTEQANAEALAAVQSHLQQETQTFSEEEASQLKAYECPSCGAQLLYGENTAASCCPYCSNPTVVPSQFEGALKPDYIIPFKLKKEDAVEQLSKYYGNKPFLPSAFTRNNHIEEVQGIYVPFWLYDGEAAVDAIYDGVKETTSDDGVSEEHYSIQRQGHISFEMVPADASQEMDDALMDSLEPFDFDEMVEFEMAYLPGYLADKFDVSAQDNISRAETRMKKSALDEIGKTLTEYDSFTPLSETVNIQPEKVHYAFLPIWYLTTVWNGKIYTFAMNGQTGKFIGDLPVDNRKFWLYFIGTSFLGILILWFILLR